MPFIGVERCNCLAQWRAVGSGLSPLHGSPLEGHRGRKDWKAVGWKEGSLAGGGRGERDIPSPGQNCKWTPWLLKSNVLLLNPLMVIKTSQFSSLQDRSLFSLVSARSAISRPHLPLLSSLFLSWHCLSLSFTLSHKLPCALSWTFQEVQRGS